ncbi:hypothetical protein PO909_010789 [Leuciscus waleckii]
MNSQTIKFSYPLPLVPAALEQLRGAHIFTKLDLRSAYNLIRIRKGDEWKTAFVTPSGHYVYQVMPYGLSNSPAIFQNYMNEVFRDFLNQFVIVYIDDILIYPKPYRDIINILISSPLTSLLKNRPKSLSWTPHALLSFEDLKTAFVSAPVLHHPISELPFVVEVDASTTGVGAVLSQRQGDPLRLHPCVFYSKKMSSAEQNYNIGNRELLAIKLAVVEWRHWQEVATHQFEVITDHRNLEYLRGAKRLNPRQARWVLFFTRFHFAVTYRPGSKNCKADVLSRLPHPDPEPATPEPILPPAMIVSPIQWALDDQIRQATLTKPAPPGGPEGRIFIPLTYRLSLIDSAHTSPGSGHPENIVSDRGPQFISCVWQAFFKHLGITISLSSGYHPKTNGQTERKIQEIRWYLRSYCHQNQDSWSRFLPWAEYAQNSLRQATTGHTPFQCVLSYQPPLLPWSDEPSEVPAVNLIRRTIRGSSCQLLVPAGSGDGDNGVPPPLADEDTIHRVQSIRRTMMDVPRVPYRLGRIGLRGTLLGR